MRGLGGLVESVKKCEKVAKAWRLITGACRHKNDIQKGDRYIRSNSSGLIYSVTLGYSIQLRRSCPTSLAMAPDKNLSEFSEDNIVTGKRKPRAPAEDSRLPKTVAQPNGKPTESHFNRRLTQLITSNATEASCGH